MKGVPISKLLNVSVTPVTYYINYTCTYYFTNKYVFARTISQRPDEIGQFNDDFGFVADYDSVYFWLVAVSK